MQQLQMIRGSPSYADRLADTIKQKLRLVDKVSKNRQLLCPLVSPQISHKFPPPLFPPSTLHSPLPPVTLNAPRSTLQKLGGGGGGGEKGEWMVGIGSERGEWIMICVVHGRWGEWRGRLSFFAEALHFKICEI